MDAKMELHHEGQSHVYSSTVRTKIRQADVLEIAGEHDSARFRMSLLLA